MGPVVIESEAIERRELVADLQLGREANACWSPTFNTALLGRTRELTAQQRLNKLETVERKNTGGSSAELVETAKRLKKREMECQALWDTIKDIGSGYDVDKIIKIMSKRALDAKGRRKLGLE